MQPHQPGGKPSSILSQACLVLISLLISLCPTFSGSSQPVSAQTLPKLARAAMLPPGSITAQAANQTVTLTWSPANGASRYRVYRSLAAWADFQPVTEIDASPLQASYQFTDTRLINQVRYDYRLTSLDGQGNESIPSSVIQAVPNLPLSSVRNFQPNLTVDYFQDGNAPVLFSADYDFDGLLPVTGAIGLRCQIGFGNRQTAPVSWTHWVEARILDPRTTPTRHGIIRAEIVPTAVTADKAIDFLFRCSTDQGLNWTYDDLNGQIRDPNAAPILYPGRINITAISHAGLPAAPEQLSTLSTGKHEISLTWQDTNTPNALRRYDIYRAASPDAVPVWVGQTSPTTRQFKDGLIAAGTPFYYTVRAVDIFDHTSPPSSPLTAATQADAVMVEFRVAVPQYSPGTVFLTQNIDALQNPMNCDPTADLCTLTLALQNGALFPFFITRGSADTAQTLADGNTLPPAPAFTVNGSMAINLRVEQWQDPLVIAKNPTGKAADRFGPISVYWNQAMPDTTRFSIDARTNGPSGPVYTPVSGSFHNDPSRRATLFTPDAPLTPNQTYRVRVEGQVDQIGTPQQILAEWFFTTGAYRVMLPVMAR